MNTTLNGAAPLTRIACAQMEPRVGSKDENVRKSLWNSLIAPLPILPI